MRNIVRKGFHTVLGSALLIGLSVSVEPLEGQQPKKQVSIGDRNTPGPRVYHGPKLTISTLNAPRVSKKGATRGKLSEDAVEEVRQSSVEEEAGGQPVYSPVHGTNVRAAGGPGTATQSEISMAVAGPNIVISFNDFSSTGPSLSGVASGFVTSTNGGLTFTTKAAFPAPAGSNQAGDPALVADGFGRFYFVQIYDNDGAAPTAHCTNSLQRSTDGGLTWSGIIGSPFSYNFGTVDFPDQPHPAIDKINLVSGQPQIYVYTRHFNAAGINCPRTGGSAPLRGEVTCSTDGGATWAAPFAFPQFDGAGNMDVGHMATGTDGSVYIVARSDTSGGAARYMIRRSTNRCAAGLNFGAAVTVEAPVSFGALGGSVDREGQQAFVAVDKLNPNIAYVAWSSDRLLNDGNRDIFLARCTFSGTGGSCEAPVRVNDDPIANAAAQYDPTICVDPNNVINLSWNDQRAGSGSTAIFHTEVTTSGGALSVGPSFLVSEVNFTPANFGGTPDYGDYNENNDACDGNHFYVAWASQVSPPGITPASNDVDVFFSVVNNLQDIRVKAPLDFGTVCSPETHQLELFNAGDAPLTVNSVTRVSGSTDITIASNPVTPLTIQPAGTVGFAVTCSPSGTGAKTATIRISSNDPDQPQIDVTATCNEGFGTATLSMANTGNFGDVCVDGFKDMPLTITNSGTCPLNVTGLSVSGGDTTQFLTPGSGFPATIGAGGSLASQIRFQPTSFGAKATTVNVASNDPAGTKSIGVSGNAPTGDLKVSGSTDFGNVCAGAQSEKQISVCNVGKCNLNVTSATLVGCDGNFTLVNSPFPAPVSPDFCAPLTVRFTPQTAGPHSCNLVITTDDPTDGTATLLLTANTPSAVIDVPPSVSFLPEVIQSLGVCTTAKPFPVSNNGSCNLTVNSMTISGVNGGDYSLSGQPSFPIPIQPGHIVGEGALKAVFAPTVLDRDRLGSLNVTYVSEPITGATTTVSSPMCGEGVKTGARVLVTVGGSVAPLVEKIQLQRITGNRNRPQLNTVDVSQNLTPVTVTPASPCQPFTYHKEYSTVANDMQLLPGSYQVTVTVVIGGKRQTKTIGFDVGTCDFNPNILVAFL